MYRTALRTSSRSALRSNPLYASGPARRFLSTASPADKSRTWKSSTLRLGLAVGAVYYYSTSSVFADEIAPQTMPLPVAFADDDLPTVNSVLEEKRKEIQSRTEKKKPSPETPQPTEQQQPKDQNESAATAVDGSPEALEEEAGQQGAFNPETGEINWDCPCLGGMAQGPCGEDFKTAFSCFVHSEEEPKGMDCIEKFQGMQDCFRKYPEIYGAELTDDEENDIDAAVAPVEPAADDDTIRSNTPSMPETKTEDSLPEVHSVNAGSIPAEWDDATAANEQMTKEENEEKKEKKEKEEASS